MMMCTFASYGKSAVFCVNSRMLLEDTYSMLNDELHISEKILSFDE